MSKVDGKLLILACMKVASDINDIEIGPDTLCKLYYRSVIKDAANIQNFQMTSHQRLSASSEDDNELSYTTEASPSQISFAVF